MSDKLKPRKRQRNLRAPHRAYIVSSHRTGPDTWKDHKVEHIVWAQFKDWALVSLAGGGDLRVVHTDVLRKGE